jgi:hypothetical protein
MCEALKLAFPAVEQELQGDLWPLMLRRMEQRHSVIPWYDWVLAGAVTVAFGFFPKLALLLAYHL